MSISISSEVSEVSQKSDSAGTVQGEPSVQSNTTIGTLYDILQGRKGVQGSEPNPVLTWNQRMKILVLITRGIKSLHDEGLIHGSITSTNILLFDNNFNPKIADSTNNQSQILPAKGYRDPQFGMTGRLTVKSDIYAFAVVILEILTGRKPFDDTAPMGEQVLWSCFGNVSENTWKDKVLQSLDPKAGIDYPLKAISRVLSIVGPCFGYEPEFRPSIDILAIYIRHMEEAMVVEEETPN